MSAEGSEAVAIGVVLCTHCDPIKFNKFSNTIGIQCLQGDLLL